MSVWTDILAKVEGQKAYAPAAMAAFAAAGITVNADGTVVMPDGTKGTFDPTTGIITLADGSTVALAAYDPNQGNVKPPQTGAGNIVDLTLWWEQVQSKVKWTGIVGLVGVAAGAGIGFSLAGPVGARVGAAVVGALGAFIGYEES